MPIPFALGTAALAAAGLGVKKAIDAKNQFSEAGQLTRQASREFLDAQEALESRRSTENYRLAELGRTKLRTQSESLGRFVELANQVTNVQRADIALGNGGIQLEKVDLKQVAVSAYEATDFLAHGLSGASTGMLVGAGLGQAVGWLGAASTGTAISGLTGAAATNATLAWLGGGSLASGGFGMAGGAMVLGSVITGPVIAVMGLMAASQSEKALTQAHENAAEVAKAVEQMRTLAMLLDAVGQRVGEVADVLRALDRRLWKIMGRVTWAVEQHQDRQPGLVDYGAMRDREKRDFDAMLLIGTALFHVLKIKLLDEQGRLTPESATVLKNTQHLLGEQSA